MISIQLGYIILIKHRYLIQLYHHSYLSYNLYATYRHITPISRIHIPGADTGGARGALAPPPHDCQIYDFKIDNMVKSAKPIIDIIGRFIHILF